MNDRPLTQPKDQETITIEKILEMAEKFKRPEPTHRLIMSQYALDALNSQQPNELLRIKDGEQIGTDIVNVSDYMEPRTAMRIPMLTLKIMTDQ